MEIYVFLFIRKIVCAIKLQKEFFNLEHKYLKLFKIAISGKI